MSLRLRTSSDMPSFSKSDRNIGEAPAETEDEGAMLVILSDVWLDKPEVMAHLKRLLVGYSAMPPTAFVFMGNFMASSTEAGPGRVKIFKDLLKNLSELLLEHRTLANNSKFIFSRIIAHKHGSVSS